MVFRAKDWNWQMPMSACPCSAWFRTYSESCLPAEEFERLRFEWAWPSIASKRRREGRPYPMLTEDGELVRDSL